MATQESGTAAKQAAVWGARARDWADSQERQGVPALYDAIIDKVGVGEGKRLLDVGCGAGLFCQTAAARGAEVSGFDATEEFIAIARERTPEADFRVGEMEQLPYGDGEFDVVTGFNSFQFAADPVNALREARRVARQGAPVAMTTWGVPENQDAAAYLGALRPLLPPTPPDAPGPFALSQEGALAQLAEKAGMTPGESAEYPIIWDYPDLDAALRGLMSAGPAVAAGRNSGDDAVREAITSSLEPFKTDSGGYRLENSFRYVIAKA